MRRTFPVADVDDAAAVVDHDPAPLRQRFAVEHPGESDGADLAFGPRVWRVRVKRLA